MRHETTFLPMQPKKAKGAMQKRHSEKKISLLWLLLLFPALKKYNKLKKFTTYQFFSLPTPNTPGKTPSTKGLSQALHPHIPTALISRDQLPSQQNCISRVSS